MACNKPKCRARMRKREGWHCHHEIAKVRKKALKGLTPQELEALKQKLQGIRSERPEERRDLPLPRPITVLSTPPPGSGKRK